MPLNVTPIPVLTDNYVWVIHDVPSQARAVVDPGDAGPVLDALQGAALDMILLTHHHDDHTAGTDRLRAETGARVVGPASEAYRLPELDIAVKEGDVVTLGSASCRVIETPGHVLGHVTYYFEETPALFTGDTIFSLGCGRLFEGTPEMMFRSIRKFASLPDDTKLYCAHEYTLRNLDFVRTLPTDHDGLEAFSARILKVRAEGKPSLPTTLGLERALNPFLKAGSVAEFARLRAARDQS